MFTHLISYLVFHKYLGLVPASFRTTDDAVEMHRKALAIRCHAGEVCNVVIAPIAA